MRVARETYLSWSSASVIFMPYRVAILVPISLVPQSAWLDQSINRVDIDEHGSESTWRAPSEHAQIDSKWHPTANLATEFPENVLSEYFEPR